MTKPSRKERKEQVKNALDMRRFLCAKTAPKENEKTMLRNVFWGLTSVALYHSKYHLDTLFYTAINFGGDVYLDIDYFLKYSRMEPEDCLKLIDICLMWENCEAQKKNMSNIIIPNYDPKEYKSRNCWYFG